MLQSWESVLDQTRLSSAAWPGPDASDERRERPLKKEKKNTACVQCVRLWQRVEASRAAVTKKKKGGELQGRDQRGSVVTAAWEYTSICATERNILYAGSNSVGFVHLAVHIYWAWDELCSAAVWASCTGGSDRANLILWTSCNFEQDTWMKQLPRPRAQGKTYFHINTGNTVLFIDFFFFLGGLSHTYSCGNLVKR